MKDIEMIKKVQNISYKFGKIISSELLEGHSFTNKEFVKISTMVYEIALASHAFAIIDKDIPGAHEEYINMVCDHAKRIIKEKERLAGDKMMKVQI